MENTDMYFDVVYVIHHRFLLDLMLYRKILGRPHIKVAPILIFKSIIFTNTLSHRVILNIVSKNTLLLNSEIKIVK